MRKYLYLIIGGIIMKQDEIKKLELINGLQKKQNRLLRRISRLYDLAIWAGNRITKLQTKVNRLQDQITKHVNELDEKNEVEAIINTIEKQVEKQPKEGSKPIA